MLKINNLTVHYGSIKVLNEMNISVPKGKITCLLGSNGAGKTTTIKSIMGLAGATGGEILFNSEKISSLKTHQIVRKGIASIPEGRRLFPRLTVEDNLLIGACTMEDPKRIRQNLEKSYQLFPRLEERKKQVAGTLSGGEQQMVAMCRALMSEPQLLLMDEPSLGLAPILIKEIFATITRINKEGTTILLIEQNAHKAIEIADYVYVLQKGQIVMESGADNMLGKEQIKDAYLNRQTNLSA